MEESSLHQSLASVCAPQVLRCHLKAILLCCAKVPFQVLVLSKHCHLAFNQGEEDDKLVNGVLDVLPFRLSLGEDPSIQMGWSLHQVPCVCQEYRKTLPWISCSISSRSWWLPCCPSKRWSNVYFKVCKPVHLTSAPTRLSQGSPYTQHMECFPLLGAEPVASQVFTILSFCFVRQWIIVLG